MSELKVIYLGPACQEQGKIDGREWCQDDVWDACECGHESVRYVLASEFDRVTAEREALQQRLNAADQRIDDLERGPGEEFPPCDYCGTVPDYHPWHGAGLINDAESPHIHACSDCRHKLPSAISVASRDESIHWLKRIDGIGQNRAELIYSMGFRRHTEVPQS